MSAADLETPLDAAQRAIDADPEAEAPRLAFHASLAAAEVFLLLEAEAEGDSLTPRLFDLEEGAVVLAFDSEARLADFAAGPAPYAALPGRRLIAMLAGRGIGLGLNLEVAPSATLLPPEVIDWLAETLAQAPEALVAAPEQLLPPALPEALLRALDARLARATGLARSAWLCAVRHSDGGGGHMLVFVGAVDRAEAALVQTVGEAVRLAGTAASGPVDVAFLSAGDPLEERLARVGLRFDIPEPAGAAAVTPPGLESNLPPRLR